MSTPPPPRTEGRRPPEPPAPPGESGAPPRQFVRKVSGYRTPSARNSAAFEAAIAEVAHISRHLLEDIGASVEEGPDRWKPGSGRVRRAAPVPDSAVPA